MSNRIIQPIKFRLKRKQLESSIDDLKKRIEYAINMFSLDEDDWRAFADFQVNDPKFRNDQYDMQLRNIREDTKIFEDDLTFFMDALEEDISEEKNDE